MVDVSVSQLVLSFAEYSALHVLSIFSLLLPLVQSDVYPGSRLNRS
jgi:hypothetical protein